MTYPEPLFWTECTRQRKHDWAPMSPGAYGVGHDLDVAKLASRSPDDELDELL